MDVGRDEVLAGVVGVDDRADEVLRDVGKVRQKLLGIPGQAVASIPERGAAVMGPNAGTEAHALNDLPRI